jgi:hypothetical protein
MVPEDTVGNCAAVRLPHPPLSVNFHHLSIVLCSALQLNPHHEITPPWPCLVGVVPPSSSLSSSSAYISSNSGAKNHKPAEAVLLVHTPSKLALHRPWVSSTRRPRSTSRPPRWTSAPAATSSTSAPMSKVCSIVVIPQQSCSDEFSSWSR